MLCSVDTMSGSETALQGPPRDVYSTVYRPFIHRLIHSVDEAVDSTRWGSIGSEHPRVHVLMYTDEHVGEAPISSPPDEHVQGATYV